MSDNQEATFHGKQESIAELMEATGELHSLTVLPETVGDWAGHTPNHTPQQPAGEQVFASVGTAPGTLISLGIGALVTISGENSRDHGFHEDWPLPGYPIVTATGEPAADVRAEFVEGHKMDLRRAIVEKLALIHEEISESLGEIRSGEDPLEIYFLDHKGHAGPKGFRYSKQYYGLPGSNRHPEEVPCREGDVPLLKPEGFLVELADAMIRISDLVYLLDGLEEFIESLHAKHEYNSTRPYKHGRKF